ncbi:hypothetical protein NQ314_016225 [Rhamnusium bicolor]|uniref:Uncharacterized protein n=1 Tax=Rhamnusium bicolor TaxID=1586634 RepID=A0AAV8WZ71_9CUCU|nr:hypothetical protein NQ314_016225 [Rhamnusium bicolor]
MPAKIPNISGNICNNENCRLSCNSKFNTDAREQIFKKFYTLDVNSKNALLFKSIIIKPMQRHRKNIVRSKSASFQYSITYNKQIIIVCKNALCSLYRISEKLRVVRTKLTVSSGSAPTPDKRGRHDTRLHKISNETVDAVKDHINQFPAESSHYSRHKIFNKKYLSPELNITKMYNLYIEDCDEKKRPEMYKVKKCTYSKIFSTNFNLSFGHPKSDTCSTCDAGLNTD